MQHNVCITAFCGSQNLNENALTAGICLPYDNPLEEVQPSLCISWKGIHFAFHSLLMDKITNATKNQESTCLPPYVGLYTSGSPKSLSRDPLNSVYQGPSLTTNHRKLNETAI